MRMAVLVLTLSPVLWADVDSLKKEPNPERRSDLALEEADREVDNARQAYKRGDDKAFKALLNTIGTIAQLSYDSLKSTGKSARKHPKYFKRADLKMRGLARRIEGLEQEVGYDDRPPVVTLKNKILELDEQIVLDVMKK